VSYHKSQSNKIRNPGITHPDEEKMIGVTKAAFDGAEQKITVGAEV
jgi:hypothetical protein